MQAEEQQESAEATVEEGGNKGAVCPPSSPIHMRALDTPTFGLMYSTAKQTFRSVFLNTREYHRKCIKKL